jgi:hypothetical protein
MAVGGGRGCRGGRRGFGSAGCGPGGRGSANRVEDRPRIQPRFPPGSGAQRCVDGCVQKPSRGEGLLVFRRRAGASQVAGAVKTAAAAGFGGRGSDGTGGLCRRAQTQHAKGHQVAAWTGDDGSEMCCPGVLVTPPSPHHTRPACRRRRRLFPVRVQRRFAAPSTGLLRHPWPL